MPLGTLNMGVHEDIPFVKFGSGDIKMSTSKYQGNTFETLILFHEEPGRQIGEINSDFVGKSSDELPKPGLVFEFTNPKSITALIHTLVELQKEVFEYHEQQNSESKNK